MRKNFIETKIDKVIIHKVYKRENKDMMVAPFYNDACSKLDEDAKRALVTRITRAFGSDSHSITMDIEDSGEESVYKCISDFWVTDQSDEKFIALSKRLTLMLAKVQNSCIYPDSVIVILKGRTRAYQADYVAIIKAEIQDGFNVEESNGQQLLSYVNNLLLTKQQKLHKIAFFINNQVKERKVGTKDVTVCLFDSNTADSVSNSKATYFYKNFLGLKFKEDADVMTNKFYMVTKKIINDSNTLSSYDKYSLQTALHNYLVIKQSTTFNPAEFASEYFSDNAFKDAYLKELEKSGVPRENIRKDLSMIKNTKVRRLAFENSIKITVPIDEIDESVNIEESDDGYTIVKIKGKYINE